MTDQQHPRCLAWVEGAGRCEKTTGARSAPHCPQHQTAGWSFCERRRCGLWAIVYTGLEWRCGWHEGEHYLGGSRLAAEQVLEAAEALASWLRAAVESRSASTEEAHRAYVARHGCPWPAGSCEVCQVAPPAPARCAVSWYCPDAPEEGSTYCRAHRCGTPGCEGARWRSFGLCAGCLPGEVTR